MLRYVDDGASTLSEDLVGVVKGIMRRTPLFAIETVKAYRGGCSENVEGDYPSFLNTPYRNAFRNVWKTVEG